MNSLQTILINKRKGLKLSLRAASDLIGISHSYLSTLEKGIDPRTGSPVKPTPETLKLISDAYNIKYEVLMSVSGYFYFDFETPLEIKKEIHEKYPQVNDVEEAMKVILEQPGLMLKGELLSDESKIILANAIQMGLRTAEELEKKKNKGDKDE